MLLTSQRQQEIESELKKKPEELSTRYTGAVRIRSEGSKLWKDKYAMTSE